MHKTILTASLLGALGLAGSVSAAAPTQSLRPEARPIPADAPESSVRPAIRETEAAVTSTNSAGFRTWLDEFARKAETQGVKRDTIRQAFSGITYDARVVERDRNQSEFTKTIWDYLDTAVSQARVENGKAALDRQNTLLDRVEATYGVEKEIVVAIWGLESAYGNFRGSDNTIQSLATLAYDTRRRAFFEDQLLEALRILDAGHVSAANMKGSWAGAMGHTQFMPTSFRDHAVDFTGDGKRNIWSDDPSDALASTAAYLKNFGWTTGQPWGVEVQVPNNFDYRLANRDITKRPGEWAAMGIVDIDARAVPDHGPASILLPAGGRGAAFMIFDNFEVLERYNTADAYVIGVGHLSDRIAGKPAIQGTWPREDRALTYDERVELQKRLTAKGFDTQKIDGKIGPLTINAVRAYQIASNLLPDGYASLRLLEGLR